jgi:hypothetical protein
MTAVIETEMLTRSYGAHRGIIEVDLEVQAGEIFGFLGPNGAGKTTAVASGGLAIAFYLVDTLGAAFQLPTAILDLSLTRHLGHPMIGTYDPAGVVVCFVLPVGGVTLGAWGIQRRDVGR